MSKTVFILKLNKAKARKPSVKPGKAMDDDKAYSRKEKHKKRARALLLALWEE